MLKLLKEHPLCDSACFYTDYHALGAAEALKESDIPAERIKIFGLGDYTVSRFTNIPLTTARFDMDHIGDLILEHLTEDTPLNCAIQGTIIEYPFSTYNKGDCEK